MNRGPPPSAAARPPPPRPRAKGPPPPPPPTQPPARPFGVELVRGARQPPCTSIELPCQQASFAIQVRPAAEVVEEDAPAVSGKDTGGGAGRRCRGAGGGGGARGEGGARPAALSRRPCVRRAPRARSCAINCPASPPMASDSDPVTPRNSVST